MGARDFWQSVLGAAGFTALPRWTALVDAPAGIAEHEVALTAPPSPAQLLAAHAKVISALSGESEVLTGYVPSGHIGAPLPCAIAVGGTWPELVAQADKAAKDVAAHAAEPFTGDAFEVVLGESAELPENVVLWVSEKDGQLRLRYRTEAFDADHVARIAGYYRTALDLPEAVSLLSHEELDFQFDGLAGPERELPDRRFHELFEDRVRQHPDTIAAVHGDRSWTYAELNGRANRIGRALRARGLTSQDVVAVVTERNLDWLASVLAIFKAGGGYLPIEPHFPSDRIAKTLTRAGCTFVLTERGSTATLDGATENKIYLDEVYAEDHDDSDLGIAVGEDDLAYIYFTSGSTGEPKGAMCEHAGMLNHLYAKIDDLGITEGSVVAQIAPQCFDISLWQLVSALLVGGRTVLVEQEAILDVERFVRLVSNGVDVMQVVPSYLEVVLSHLEEHPGDLGRLRCVSATGEALKKELTERWFAAFPGIKLANAYGLTETCDDTNHEVMDRAPERERVPLGRAVNNVRVYVVDDNLNPVPLGSPGEIVFSGVCVGRGYINDPERTAAAFLTDPHREGERLYRSGDFGRWLPEGKLEFLGRRDAQVKIRGFRIEIGEIENRLLGVAGVRDAAVVVAEWPDRGKTLVAYYSTSENSTALSADELREHLAAELPEYMVPSHFHSLESLPLTGNGKIDKKKLTAAASELKVDDIVEAPQSPTELRIAAAWADVLGVAPEKVGRGSHFFNSGGTSLSAVRLVVKLERAVSLKELTRTPVLADLAAFIDGKRQESTGLLQPLSTVDGAATTLICFPYAGGNAVNFQPLATALAGSGIAVHAVELPGHDLSAQREPFAEADQVAKAVVAEIAQRGIGPVLLWGHSSGAALAVLTARLLEEQNHDVRQVFVGAQLVGEIGDRESFTATITALSDLEITARLSGDSAYTELGGLDTERAALVGAAYRHDVVVANRFFVAAHEESTKLATPLTVVVAADDKATEGHGRESGKWPLLAENVEVRELAEGGHYFPRTRPAETAAVIKAVNELCSNGKGRL
ncbi:amino acid adenylation domain-containing protein [Allokutzneria sp. A3M-2-11 16]|uniref:non-ribosomal peptide synthetase n=1 Tax=Allokutzneria sp. A3M-2-11 16 TaxID=2962043 RepID=UPI0020B75CA7|nr:amino acid adenylation domain-containing protein [Allokutzneria sp. A3M-2-11 16]MCP3804562.1 amino acid adenylation domain-containing protein [Allokutzneria sp. A3M-2-11 16]